MIFMSYSARAWYSRPFWFDGYVELSGIIEVKDIPSSRAGWTNLQDSIINGFSNAKGFNVNHYVFLNFSALPMITSTFNLEKTK